MKLLKTISFLFILASATLSAQSYDQFLSEIPKSKTLKELDNNALTLQYAAHNRNKNNAFRFAESIEVQFNLISEAKKIETSEESLYLTRISSPGALTMNFGFDAFQLTENCEIYFHASDGSATYGPLTPADNENHAQYWTQIFPHNDMVIEVNVKSDADLPYLNLHKVNHGFTTLANIQKSGSCNLDVVCTASDGFPQNDDNRDLIQSGAFYTLNGINICSGALINNVNQDNTPYFLTANHCGVRNGNVASMVVYWNYENSFCRQPNSAASGQTGNGSLSTFNSGAFLRARLGSTDFCLVELDDPVNPAANAFFAGYDALRATATSTIGVHHPALHEKRISYDFDPTVFVDGNDNPDPNGDYHMVLDWDIGTTEGGSSGSPLFDQNKRIVGQLFGGFAACGNDSYDVYGAVASSWEGGGAPANRLKDWLDPANTGVLVVDGKWANPMANPPIVMGDVINHVSCFEGMDGSIQLSGSEGMPPYMFNITGLVGNATGLFENLTAGTYECVVTDSDNMSDTIELTVDQPSVLLLSGFGGVNMLTLSGVGGTPPFLYSIDNLNFGADNIFTSLTPGPITAYVRDNNGCEANAEFHVLKSFELDSLTVKGTTCPSGNGELIIYVSGGITPYSYSLDGQPFIGTSMFVGLTGGLHDLKIVDSDGELIEAQVTIPEDEVLEAIINVMSNNIELGAINGLPPYVFELDGSGFTSVTTYNNLEDGWHYYGIMDDAGCTIRDSILLGVQLDGIVTEIPCDGMLATIDLSLLNGVAPIEYKIDTFPYDTLDQFDMLAAGSYIFYARDVNGQSDTLNVIIPEADSLFLLHTWTANDFALNLSVSNSDLNGSYFYANDTSMTGSFYPVGPGTHPVSFISDEGCIVFDTVLLVRDFEVFTQIEDEFCESSNGLLQIDSVQGFYIDLITGFDTIVNDVSLPFIGDFASAGTTTLVMQDSFGTEYFDVIVNRIEVDYPLSYEIVNDTLKIRMDSIYDIQNFTIELEGVGISPTACFYGMPDGQYQVFLTSPHPSYCRDTLDIDYFVAVQNQAYDKFVRIQPNPVYDLLTVNWTEINLSDYIVLDVLGRTVAIGEINPAERKHQLNVSTFDTGLYVLKLRGSGVEVNKQFIKIE